MHLLFWVSPQFWSYLALGVYTHTAEPGYSYHCMINISVLVCFVFLISASRLRSFLWCLFFTPQPPRLLSFFSLNPRKMRPPPPIASFALLNVNDVLRTWKRGALSRLIKWVRSVSLLCPVQTSSGVFMARDRSPGWSCVSAGGRQPSVQHRPWWDIVFGSVCKKKKKVHD